MWLVGRRARGLERFRGDAPELAGEVGPYARHRDALGQEAGEFIGGHVDHTAARVDEPGLRRGGD